MKVLYATDGMEAAIGAGRLLKEIGDRERVEVTVMSVTHTGIPAPEYLPLMLDSLPSRRQDALKIVDASVQQLLASGFRARGHTAEGHPGQEIVRAVEQDWYDLIVMGGASRSWLGNRLLGSVSTYVLHASPWSVLIAHKAPENGEVRVLVGADGSRSSDFTIANLSQFADSARTQITVVSVAPSSPLLPPSAGPTPSPHDAEQNGDLERRIRGRTQRTADKAATTLRDAGFSVQAHIALGNPTEELLKEADKGEFDLVAVGSRGLGPLRRELLGSVSDHVVRQARAALVGRRLIT